MSDARTITARPLRRSSSWHPAAWQFPARWLRRVLPFDDRALTVHVDGVGAALARRRGEPFDGDGLIDLLLVTEPPAQGDASVAVVEAVDGLHLGYVIEVFLRERARPDPHDHVVMILDCNQRSGGIEYVA